MDKQDCRTKHICLTIFLVAWMILIFSRSLQPSEQSSMESQWVLDCLQSLSPWELTMLFVRKMAHFIEFAVLGILASWRFVKRFPEGVLPSLFIGVVTALCDETIQLFVEGRSGQLQDVWLDIAGIVTGLLLTVMVSAIKIKVAQKR